MRALMLGPDGVRLEEVPPPLPRAGEALLRISVAGAPRLVPDLLEDLRAAGLPVAEVEVTRPTLDDVFLKLTGRSLREGGAAATTDRAPALVEV